MKILPERCSVSLCLVISFSLIISAVSSLAQSSPMAVSQDIKHLLEFMHEETVDTFELGELVPSRRQRFGTISSVYEVTAQDILNQNARSVGEALRFVPGVVYGQGGARNEGTISIRGLGKRSGLSSDDKQYSVFIDGRPVLEPFLGTVDLFNLPIDNVAKIKIVKGAASAPFGPNTLGGVINIITKKGTPTTTTRATLSYEQFNTQDYWLQHGGQHNKLKYFFAGSIRRSNGFDLSSEFTPMPFEDGGRRDQAKFQKYNLSMNVGYDFTEENKLAFQFGYYKADFQIPLPTVGFQAFSENFTRFTDWDRFFLDLTGEARLSDSVVFKGKLYFDKFDNDLTFFTDKTFSTVKKNFFTGGNVVSVFDNHQLGSNLQATVDLADNLTTKIGTFVRWDAVNRQRDSASPFENFETLTTDYFMDVTYYPVENVMLYAGFNYDTLFTLNSFFARTDQSERFHSFNPIGSIMYQPWAGTRLHTTIAKKSNMPRMQNLFGRSAGNLNLEPENNLSFEAGAAQRFWEDRAELEITYFHNKADNIIELQDRPGGPIFIPEINRKSFVEFANTDSYTSLGVEAILSVHWTDEIFTSLGYTYVNFFSRARGASLDARNPAEGGGPLDPSSPLLQRPKHQVNLLATYESSFGLSAFLQGSYHSEFFDLKALDSDPNRLDANSVIRIGSFFLLNGKLSYELWPGMKPFFAVENLFDSNYEAIRGFPQPGRRYFFGVNATL